MRHIAISADTTANAGSDYAIRTTNQSIPAGQDCGTFTITVNGDTLKEDITSVSRGP